MEENITQPGVEANPENGAFNELPLNEGDGTVEPQAEPVKNNIEDKKI